MYIQVTSKGSDQTARMSEPLLVAHTTLLENLCHRSIMLMYVGNTVKKEKIIFAILDFFLVYKNA